MKKNACSHTPEANYLRHTCAIKETGVIFFYKTIDLYLFTKRATPGCVAQWVTCLATDAKLTADPGVVTSIPARSHTFVEIDHKVILRSFSSFR